MTGAELVLQLEFCILPFGRQELGEDRIKTRASADPDEGSGQVTGFVDDHPRVTCYRTRNPYKWAVSEDSVSGGADQRTYLPGPPLCASLGTPNITMPRCECEKGYFWPLLSENAKLQLQHGIARQVSIASP